ncbi:MAG: hypothetical protein ACHQ1H_12330 [Nitrososphaerales archaeon]
MKLPSFFQRKNAGEIERFERPSSLNSNAECMICSPQTRKDKTAKLLIVTGQWNYYYCYRCRGWFQAHFSSKNLVLRVDNKRIENSLTWFWKSENEMIEENRRALEWVYSLFSRRRVETPKALA